MRINARLEGAGSQLNASEWLLLHTSASPWSPGFLGTVHRRRQGRSSACCSWSLGAVLPWMYLGFKRSRRRKAFGRGLPDTLQLMSGSLTAGLSLAQSIDTIVNEGAEPIASEFRRVLVETRLGVSLETALEGVAERFEQQGLRLGRDGHQHPAPGRWQPGRAARDGGRHDPRARVHAPSGRRPGGRGQAVGVRARRPAAAVLHLPAASRATTTSRRCSAGRWAG